MPGQEAMQVQLASFSPAEMLATLHRVARSPAKEAQETYGAPGIASLRWREAVRIPHLARHAIKKCDTLLLGYSDVPI